MKGLIVFILSVLLNSPFTTQDITSVNHSVICTIAGRIRKSTYIFDITQLPKRCVIFTVGQYCFDNENNNNTGTKESVKGIITSLVEANKTVYTRVGFSGNNDDWLSIFYPEDTVEYQNKIINPLINFLNSTKVNGILINCKDFYTFPVNDFAVKLSNFVSELKSKMGQLIVGLIISGLYYPYFQDNSLFDYTMTNKVIDLYVISLAVLNKCDNVTKYTGLSPVKSNIPGMVTIEQVTASVMNSSMDESKLFAMLKMFPLIPENLAPNITDRLATYTMYCKSTGQDNSYQWCTNPSKLSYDQGAFTKKFYFGIILEPLETDDYEGVCGCGEFPVTNLMIDGWTASPYKTCLALDLFLNRF